jgi:hypothetical protein
MGPKGTFKAQKGIDNHENTKVFSYQEIWGSFVKNTWYIIGIIIAAIGIVITLRTIFSIGFGLISVLILVVITFCSLLGLSISLNKIIIEQNGKIKVSEEKVKELAEKVNEGDSKVEELIKCGKIIFFDKEEEATIAAIKLLKGVENSLYYFGAAGFISDNNEWKKTLAKKMVNTDIKFVRLIDLKSLKEMVEILKGMVEDKEISEYVEAYKEWLDLHSAHLRSRSENNIFYKFDGAPLWKFGINIIIFDDKNICIVFLSAKENKNAIFVYDCPDIAKAMINYSDWVAHFLGLEKIGYNELEGYAVDWKVKTDLSDNEKMGKV